MGGVVAVLGAVVVFIVVTTLFAGGSLQLGTQPGKSGNLQPYSGFKFIGGR